MIDITIHRDSPSRDRNQNQSVQCDGYILISYRSLDDISNRQTISCSIMASGVYDNNILQIVDKQISDRSAITGGVQ